MNKKTKKLINNNKRFLFVLSSVLPAIGQMIAVSVFWLLLDTLQNEAFFQPVTLLALTLVYLFVPLVIQIFGFYGSLPFRVDAMNKLRHEAIFRTLFISPSSFYRLRPTSRLAILTDDLESFEDRFFASSAAIIKGFVIIVITFSALILIDNVVIAAAVPIYLLLCYAAVAGMQKRVITLSEEVSELNGEHTAALENLFSGFEVLRITGSFENYAESYRLLSRRRERKQERALRLVSLEKGLLKHLNILFTFLALSYLSVRTFNGSLSVSTAGITVMLINQATLALSEIISARGTKLAAQRVLDRGFDLLDNSTSETIKKENEFRLQRDIELKNVNFNYGDRQIIRECSMRFPAKGKFCIVGRSGCGKSTLLHLLCGIQTPTLGEITYDGVDISSIREKNLGRGVGLITQETTFFDDTIRNNLSLYRSISDDEIWETLRQTRMDLVVKALPLGLDTVLSENGNMFSAGERQRFAIARTLLRRPELILADEMTSNLPKDVGWKIMDILLSLPATVIVSAHRDYVRKGAFDKVFDLRGGSLREVGCNADKMYV